MATTVGNAASALVKSKLDEFFWEWLSLQESQKIIRQTVQQIAKGDVSQDALAPSPHFSANRSTRPSPPGSPHARGLVQAAAEAGAAGTPAEGAAEGGPSSPRSSRPSPATSAPPPAARDLDATSRPAGGGAAVIPRFWWPKKTKPPEELPVDVRQKIREHYVRQGMSQPSDGIRTYQQLEPIVTEVFGLSKYFVVPIFHKIKVFFDIVDTSARMKDILLKEAQTPITEQMLVTWAAGKIQPEDQVLSFFYVVKKEHNDWIEREDFTLFLLTILLTHPGLDFLRDTQEFQERYSDTVISRIFFVYDQKDVGRIYLSSLRRYRPSVIETWKQLADHDDIKMVRDYFSYEHFYVIYCTFWELDTDHDFLLDKDDLLKYDGHALSRRTVDRIFSETPTKFTSTVPGKMGYEDFIRFLLCDQDRQTDRSMEYWFHMFDLDDDGCIRDHEMKYFYEEQAQRMECLNYDTIPFADIMCQMNDMISPKSEGQFKLADFKRRRKFAGTFFSLFSSLNKFLAFEHKDPFMVKQEMMDNPNFTDWDRWCADEYLRLAAEEGEDDEATRGISDGGEDDGR
mmetsp:Transcript_70351/g.153286  ORF Transcript_70351/g.153286 Transcript_70351/m.153286 type:complete len:569 (-) Transcript_70351:103-1809(-)